MKLDDIESSVTEGSTYSINLPKIHHNVKLNQPIKILMLDHGNGILYGYYYLVKNNSGLYANNTIIPLNGLISNSQGTIQFTIPAGCKFMKVITYSQTLIKL